LPAPLNLFSIQLELVDKKLFCQKRNKLNVKILNTEKYLLTY